ncbi:MAG TPA: diaminopimelate epimerase [Nocardioidaceae bacterium]|nr:diaminopimelate epimerase [Nocardioidaceae bacterium]
MRTRFEWLKGHGTENDFVLLPDPAGDVHGDLSPRLVRALCHRRRGIGADGVLRVIRSAAYADQEPLAGQVAGETEWFMDYRNSDGSVSEMCGNGVRVFARHLVEEGLADPAEPLPIGTRGGVKVVRFDNDGLVVVDMGRGELQGDVEVAVGERSWKASRISMGNPHAVVMVDDLAEAGPLLESPGYDPGDFPDGVNVEFVREVAARHVAMRVFERGSGETRSCGTGACAAALAAAVVEGGDRPQLWRVDVPGGTLYVHWLENDHVELGGPAVLGVRGDAEPRWLGL